MITCTPNDSTEVLLLLLLPMGVTIRLKLLCGSFYGTFPLVDVQSLRGDAMINVVMTISSSAYRVKLRLQRVSGITLCSSTNAFPVAAISHAAQQAAVAICTFKIRKI